MRCAVPGAHRLRNLAHPAAVDAQARNGGRQIDNEPVDVHQSIPEGPRIKAIALVRTMRRPMFNTDEPPINTEDFRICP